MLTLSGFFLDDTKTTVFAGDVKLFFNQKLEVSGEWETPYLHVLLSGKITFLDLYNDG